MNTAANEIDKPTQPVVTPYAADADSDIGSAPAQPPSLLRRFVCRRAVALTLIIAAELLAVVWYIVVYFLVDNSSLHFDYMFTPRSTTTFWVWRVMGLVLVALVFLLVATTLFGTQDSANVRWRPALACVVYIVMLVTGNIIGTIETSARKGYEDEFAVKFNDFYCNARVLRVCLEGSNREMLLLTRGNATAILASENPTDVALSVWSRCQGVLLDSMVKAAERTTRQYRKRDGEKGIETKEVYQFLDDTNGSSDIDAWCGNVYHYSTSLTVAQQKTLPSPYASNPSMFTRYKREWRTRMQFSNGFLGGTVVLLAVVTCLSW